MADRIALMSVHYELRLGSGSRSEIQKKRIRGQGRFRRTELRVRLSAGVVWLPSLCRSVDDDFPKWASQRVEFRAARRSSDHVADTAAINSVLQVRGGK